MNKITYCESIGLHVGDEIEVLQTGRIFPEGAILRLIVDTDNMTPLFANIHNLNDTGRFSLYNSRMKYLPEGSGWRRVKRTKNVKIDPLILLDALRESDPYITTIYTEGGCYRLYLALKKIYPDVIPVINSTSDHVGTIIDGEVYDINGKVDWTYRAMDDEDISKAEQWSFSKNNFLQIGECPVCDEPLVI